MKNDSSRCPAKIFPPPGSVRVAASTKLSYSGNVFGPMFGGATGRPLATTLRDFRLPCLYLRRVTV